MNTPSLLSVPLVGLDTWVNTPCNKRSVADNTVHKYHRTETVIAIILIKRLHENLQQIGRNSFISLKVNNNKYLSIHF